MPELPITIPAAQQARTTPEPPTMGVLTGVKGPHIIVKGPI